MTEIQYWRGAVLCGLAALSFCAIAQDQSDPEAKWGAQVGVEGKLGSQRALGEVDLFIPLRQDADSLLFTDLRMRADNQTSLEGNFGLGLRSMRSDGWNLGAYGYFDRRLTANSQTFDQLTLGAEALGEDWDIRANSYWPLGKKVQQVDSLSSAEISGTSVIFRGGEEHALRGFDAEIGWRVPVFEVGGPRELRLYAGGYSFSDGIVPSINGPRFRAELTNYEMTGWRDGSRVTLGAEWQTDKVRGGQGFLSASLVIPLQAGKARSSRLTPQERRMVAPIVRDVDIVVQGGAYGAAETATQLASGSSFTVINSATTTGAGLAADVLGGGSNIILSGTFQTGTNVITLNAQSLMAGAISVRSPSGRVATLNTSATIAATNASSALLMNAGGGTLSGITVTNAYSGGVGGRAVLVADGVANVTIRNNTLSVTQSGANGALALTFGNNTSGVVSGNTLTATGSGTATAMTALGANGVNTSIMVSGNILSASGGTTNNLVLVGAGTTINAGSTGNVRGSGSCNGTPASGSIVFTNGTACP